MTTEPKKKTLVINLVAGPGAGKSSLSALIFGLLKTVGIDAELVTEYAKDKTWEGSSHILANQTYVLGKQLHRVWRLDGKVDVVITDSPLILSALYAQEHKEKLSELAVEIFNSFDNLTYYINRTKAYNPNGRSQTEDEAKAIDASVLELLDNSDIKYTTVTGDTTGACQIAEDVYHRLTGKALSVSIDIVVKEES